MKISYIIPVYNAEKWIDRCLQSILLQGLPFEDYEIIVVDDGSKDNSLAKIKSFRAEMLAQRTALNMSVLCQKNSGASTARNLGLKKAQGDYIWWIDADDYIEKGSVVTLLNYAYKCQIDILHFGCNIVSRDGRVDEYPMDKKHDSIVFDGQQYIEKLGFPPNVWSSIYRREYLLDNNLFLMEGVVHEDLEFPPRAFYFAERICNVCVTAYNYVQTENSVMRTNDVDRRRKKTEDLLKICDSLYLFVRLNSLDSSSTAYIVLINHISFCFAQSLRNVDYVASRLMEYRQKEYYPLQINSFLSKNDKIKYRIINFSLPLYLFLYKMLRNK